MVWWNFIPLRRGWAVGRGYLNMLDYSQCLMLKDFSMKRGLLVQVLNMCSSTFCLSPTSSFLLRTYYDWVESIKFLGSKRSSLLFKLVGKKGCQFVFLASSICFLMMYNRVGWVFSWLESHQRRLTHCFCATYVTALFAGLLQKWGGLFWLNFERKSWTNFGQNLCVRNVLATPSWTELFLVCFCGS